MPRQGDKDKCTRAGCNGTMTYHQKLVTKDGVTQGGAVGPRNHPDGGWLCDADNTHVDRDNP